jgi:type II secretory pathway component GspD/PulD (secretin)
MIGGLFGRVGRRTTETELFLFITPRVIRSDEEAESVTEPIRKKAEGAKP